jgi:hypothetical protein
MYRQIDIYHGNSFAKKEKAELEHSVWALQNPENLKKHHKVFVEKIEYLRKAGPRAHVEAMQKWWKQKLKELKKLASVLVFLLLFFSVWYTIYV